MKQTKPNKLTGHPPRLYTKSQVDEMIDKIWENNKRVHLQQEVFYNKKIDELKAKLKEQYNYLNNIKREYVLFLDDEEGKISQKDCMKKIGLILKKWVGKK